MSSEGAKASVQQPLVEISADFLTGSTEVGLDRIRTRLLDLTNRNKLLNYRHPTASSLRAVNASIANVFQRLVENERIALSPVPEPDIETAEPPSAKDYADQLGWNTSYDLDNLPSKSPNGGSLPVLHYSAQLDTLSRKIASTAKTAIEESGTNMLYLVFGFLEWYEADNSTQSHLAPLVTVPVFLERISGKGKTIESVLEYSGEDVETNLSLVEKMRRDFGLEVSAFEDDDTPETYFERFEGILSVKKRWRIRQQITLAFLSFGKLLMYRDLDPRTWPIGQNISKHELVRQLFEGTKNPHVSLAEDYLIDAPELKPRLPSLIRDADSSQHSALVHALDGQNLVIEGPPGTGKSQTITNLIAAVLAKGKTVLFVSEKLAALEVVRRRLDDAGLGLFCLELHSHKTKKGALLNDVAQRHRAHGTFRDPADLDRHLSVVEEKKQLLTRYASLINKVIQPFNATVFETLWARERSGNDIQQHRDKLGQILLPSAVYNTRDQFSQTEQFLAIYAQHLDSVLGCCSNIEDHPWSWISRPLSFQEEDRLLTCLDDLLVIISKANQSCQALNSIAGIPLARTLQGLESTGHRLNLLPNPGDLLIGNLLATFRAAQSRDLLRDFISHVERFRNSTKQLAPFAQDTSALLDNSHAAQLANIVEHIDTLGINKYSVAQIKELVNSVAETSRLLESAHLSFQELLKTIGCETPMNLSSASLLLVTLRLIEDAPVEVLHLRQSAFERESTKPLLEAAQREANEIRSSEILLAKQFDLSLSVGMHTPGQLMECAAIVENASLWQRLFSRKYKSAITMFRRISLDHVKSSRRAIARDLRSVAEHVRKRKLFEGHSGYREILGVHFNGINSAWDDLHAVAVWYESVFGSLPDHRLEAEPFRHCVFSARVERLKAIKSSMTRLAEHRSALERVLLHITGLSTALPHYRVSLTSGSFDEIKASLERLAGDLTAVRSAIDRVALKDSVILREIPDALAAANQCRGAMASIDDAKAIRDLLGDVFDGVNTSLGSLGATLDFAESIASGALPEKTVDWLLCGEYQSRLTQLRGWLTSAHTSSEEWNQIAGDLTNISGSPLWKDSNNEWDRLQALAVRALANREELSQWSHFLRMRIEAVKAGVEKLTALADLRVLTSQELLGAYHYCFYNTLGRSIFGEHAELSQMTGITQEKLRQQFAWADKEAIRLQSKRVAALIDRKQVPYGNQSGPVRTWSEMALLINEMNKQKRHIPIRQLILRAANALVALKPCFMMGPLSVAQYLAPGKLKFDLVVMDEASQLKPEDAIGALARGGQVVIVGDPKQLPPTTFFQRVSLDGEEDDEEARTAVEEGESILDVASTLFQPVRRLRWHYRSRHHSLIAFSNNAFYGDLVIFPSAYHDDPSLGVKHHFVANGIFENSRNPSEATVVVEAVLEHMREHPDESLGVVTLNFEQRELVEELLDRRLRDDPFAIAYQEGMQGGQEIFFVKNLENVQGDERDVMFISTTYGPDARGNQYQRFGPINGPNGHRRLNVLFTRAKKRTVVFSSLDPDRIQTTAISPWGLRALKEYLIFARTGILQQADHGNDQPINDFERAVGTVLKEKGYEVVPQVGVAGFFIDLGVKHPSKAGTFLLGIECDGAGYHSGTSARDRDRLRQEILENLGWRIHRIWSTDWFKSRDNEIKRLLRHLEELLEKDPAHRAERERVTRSESLRQRLITLREKEITPEFPQSPPESDLLRKSLLDEFVEKRPKTRADWFRQFPQQLRVSIDSRQVSKYLDRVLGIIAENEQ